MSLKKDDKLYLNKYVSYVLNIITNNQSSDKFSTIESFKENIGILADEEEKISNKKIIELFYIIKYLIAFKKSNRIGNNKKVKKNIENDIENSNEKDKRTIKIIDKAPFSLYPIIFSIKPKLTQKYFNFFLLIINQCISEENKNNFSFLCKIFSETISSIFKEYNIYSDESKSNPFFQELYSQIMKFCIDLININKKLEQSFGCLLLSEIIENCPLIKNKKNSNELWKKFSNYLEDKWFLCKLDLLNCIISFIYILEQNFEPYANECLFKILGYLTDNDWMKRKISINIIYTLIFYCKKEIFNVKQNIVAFLDLLKNDKVQEVRDICIQTLNLIKEDDLKEPKKKETEEKEKKEKKEQEEKVEKEKKELEIKEKEEKEKLIENEKNNSKSIKKKIINKKKEKNINAKNKNIKNNKELSFSKEQNLYKERIKINKNKILSIFKQNKGNNRLGFYTSRGTNNSKIEHSKRISFKDKTEKKILRNNKLSNKIYNPNNNKIIINNYSFINSNKIEQKIEGNSKYASYLNITSDNNKNKSFEKINNLNHKETKDEIRNEQNISEIKENNNNISNRDEEDINNQTNNRKGKEIIINLKNKNKANKFYKLFKKNKSKTNNSFDEIDKNSKSKKNKKYNIKKLKDKFIVDCFIEQIFKETDININQKENADKKETENENKRENISKKNEKNILDFNTFSDIINKIQETNNDILIKINKLENKLEENYNKLEKRIKRLENQIELENEIKKYSNNHSRTNIINVLKEKFNGGKYDEVLLEVIKNDEYLYNILPLINKENIGLIDNSILNDVLSRLSSKIYGLTLDEDKLNVNQILEFINILIQENVEIKLINKMNMKDSLNYIKSNKKINIQQNDIITLLDRIIKQL